MFFRQEFINFYFSFKKKFFFKRKKVFLKQLNIRGIKTLAKFLLINKENNKKLIKLMKKI